MQSFRYTGFEEKNAGHSTEEKGSNVSVDDVRCAMIMILWGRYNLSGSEPLIFDPPSH